MPVLKSSISGFFSANVRSLLDIELADAVQAGTAHAPRGVRMLGATEGPALADHLMRLHPEDRRARFAHPISERRMARYVAGIDWSRSLVLGWEEAGVLRAAVQAHWPDVDWLHGNAEVAVSVERAWQRRGIGSALVPLAALEARRRRLPGLYLAAQTDNEAVRRLARRLDVALRRDGIAVEGYMPLDPHGPMPDWLSRALAAAGLGHRAAPG